MTAVLAYEAPRGLPRRAQLPCDVEAIGESAVQCLFMELETWPKPGLVSHVDNGSHDDMDAGTPRPSPHIFSNSPARLRVAAAWGGCERSEWKPKPRCWRRPRASTHIAVPYSASACYAPRPAREPAGWSILNCRWAMWSRACGGATYLTVPCCCTAMAARPAANSAPAVPAARLRRDFRTSTGSACRP